MTTPTLADLAHDFALDLAEDARTGTCARLLPQDAAGGITPRFGFVAGQIIDNEHRLGTKLDCPTCWAWHAARKKPHADQRAYVVSVLAEQRELAGENNLDAIAAEFTRILGTGNPTDSTFFTELASASIRCAYMLNISTSRRRRALLEVLGYMLLDPQIAVGRPALAAA
jgi:hypothetical protein